MPTNNAAARVLTALECALGAGQLGSALDVWARAFDIPDGPRRLNLVSSRLNTLAQDIESVRKYAVSRGWDSSVWEAALQSADNALQQVNLSAGWQPHRERLGVDVGGVRNMLRIFATMMPADDEPSGLVREIASLRAELFEFRAEIAGSAALNAELKTVLLGLVEEMLGALDEAEQGRDRFVREHVIEIAVRLEANRDLLERNADAPEVRKFDRLKRKLFHAAQIVSAASTIARAVGPVVHQVEQLLGHPTATQPGLPSTNQPRQLPSSTEARV